MTSHFVLYREVFLSSAVTINYTENGYQSVFFIERFFYCVLYSECPLSEVLQYPVWLCGSQLQHQTSPETMADGACHSSLSVGLCVLV